MEARRPEGSIGGADNQAVHSTGKPATFHSGKPFWDRRSLNPCVQVGHRFERQNPVGASAIGHDLLLARKLGEPLLQLAQRDIHRTGQVAW